MQRRTQEMKARKSGKGTQNRKIDGQKKRLKARKIKERDTTSKQNRRNIKRKWRYKDKREIASVEREREADVCLLK